MDKKIQTIGFVIPLVHPTVFITEGTEIGVGTVICARETISSVISIGKGCIITSGSIVPRKSYISNWGYFDFDRIIHYREEYKINTVAFGEEIEEDE